MSDIQKGVTLSDGTPYHASDFNNLVDEATILPDFIASKSSASPVSVDSFPFYQLGSTTIRRSTLTQLITAFPSGGDSATFALRKLGTASDAACAGNDTRLPVSVNGLRRGHGAASLDTVATPNDLTFPSVDISALTTIDWGAAQLFYADLTGDKVYTFTGNGNGRKIAVIVKLNGHSVTMPALSLGVLQVLGTGTTGKAFYYEQTALGVTGHCVTF